MCSYCYQLPFEKPLPSQIQPRVRWICDQEKIQLNDEAITSLIQSIGGDFRQILNHLQILSMTSQSLNSSSSALNEIFAKDRLIGVSTSDAAKMLFNTSVVSFGDRYNLFFTDYEMIPLMVHQNYVTSINSTQTSRNKLRKLADTADSLCDMELVHTTILKTNVLFRNIYHL